MDALAIIRRKIPFLLVTICVASPAVGADQGQNHKDIEFAVIDGHSLKLDLYLPVDESPPLVVWIYGGGWRGGSKQRCFVTWLTEHGYAVASISYRFSDKAIFPAQIHDCKAAVRWLRAHADQYGYRSDRIAVAGSSAGGHLAALMGTSGGVEELEGEVGGNLDQSSSVAAVIDFFGPTDFVLRSKTHPARANAPDSGSYQLLGGPASERIELGKLASPAMHVTKDDPPFLIFHGDQDKKVLLIQSRRMEEVYREAKLPLTLHVLEGSGHGGKEFFQGEPRKLAVTFLDQHLKSAASSATNRAPEPE